MHEQRLQIERRGIEPRQNVELVAGEVLQLVVLVVHHLRRRQVRDDRRSAILDDHGGIADPPWMLVESRAQHLAKPRPRKERGRAGMGGDESFAIIPHERQQILALLLG